MAHDDSEDEVYDVRVQGPRVSVSRRSKAAASDALAAPAGRRAKGKPSTKAAPVDVGEEAAEAEAAARAPQLPPTAGGTKKRKAQHNGDTRAEDAPNAVGTPAAGEGNSAPAAEELPQAKRKRRSKPHARHRPKQNAEMTKQLANQLFARERRGELTSPEQKERLARAYEWSQRQARKHAKSWQRNGRRG